MDVLADMDATALVFMLYLANDMARWQGEIDTMVEKYFGATNA